MILSLPVDAVSRDWSDRRKLGGKCISSYEGPWRPTKVAKLLEVQYVPGNFVNPEVQRIVKKASTAYISKPRAADVSSEDLADIALQSILSEFEGMFQQVDAFAVNADWNIGDMIASVAELFPKNADSLGGLVLNESELEASVAEDDEFTPG